MRDFLRSYPVTGAAAALALTLMCSVAKADADGPDAWRVIDVATNDTLNVRMGPGTEYSVIDRFPHDARGLSRITCVPLVTAEQHFDMSEAERNALPQRWCLMQSADNSIEGWVAQRFLGEDHAARPASADPM